MYHVRVYASNIFGLPLTGGYYYESIVEGLIFGCLSTQEHHMHGRSNLLAQRSTVTIHCNQNLSVLQ